MPITNSQFRIRFPEFADTAEYSDELVDLVIQEALERVSTSVFGSGATHAAAHGFMTAHLLSSTPYASASSALTGGQEVASVSAGPISVTYSPSGSGASASAAGLASTSYGQQFLALARIYTGAQAVY